MGKRYEQAIKRKRWENDARSNKHMKWYLASLVIRERFSNVNEIQLWNRKFKNTKYWLVSRRTRTHTIMPAGYFVKSSKVEDSLMTQEFYF